MANFFRVRFGVVSRAAGHSAAKRSAYQCCGVAVDHMGARFNFSRKSAEHAHATIMLVPDGAPAWCNDAAAVWNRAAAAERRVDAQEARTIDFSMPRAVPRHLWGAAVRHVYEPFRIEGMILQVDIHDTAASDGGRNTNVHGLATLRRIAGEGFAKTKERGWNDMLRDCGGRTVRDLVAARLNAFCEEHGIEYRADARPNAVRDLPAPEPDLPKWNFEDAKRGSAPTPAIANLRRHRTRRREWEVASSDLAAATVEREKLERTAREVSARRLESAEFGGAKLFDGDRRAAALRAWQGGEWISIEAMCAVARVKVDQQRGCLWIDLADGTTLIDSGDAIRLRGAVTWMAADETSAAAERHGWSSVRVFGDAAYRDSITVACSLRGIPVVNHSLSPAAEEMLKAKLAERASAAPATRMPSTTIEMSNALEGSRAAHLRVLKRRQDRAGSEAAIGVNGHNAFPAPAYRPARRRRHQRGAGTIGIES